MKIVQHENTIMSLGSAVDLLRRHQPFSDFLFGKQADMLMGQIKRSHYFFALDGNRPVGYIGWGMCEESIAEAWLRGDYLPTYDDCLSGSCFLGLTICVENNLAFRSLISACKARYPKTIAYFNRVKGGKKRMVRIVNR